MDDLATLRAELERERRSLVMLPVSLPIRREKAIALIEQCQRVTAAVLKELNNEPGYGAILGDCLSPNCTGTVFADPDPNRAGGSRSAGSCNECGLRHRSDETTGEWAQIEGEIQVTFGSVDAPERKQSRGLEIEVKRIATIHPIGEVGRGFDLHELRDIRPIV